MSYRAILLLGILTPTKSELEVTMSDTIDFFLHNTVNGPGQNFLLIICSILFSLSLTSTIDSIYYRELQCTIKGSVKGLSLVKYILLQASSLKILAPNPYTVSVGKATNYPLTILYAAFHTLSLFDFTIQEAIY